MTTTSVKNIVYYPRNKPYIENHTYIIKVSNIIEIYTKYDDVTINIYNYLENCREPLSIYLSVNINYKIASNTNKS